MKTVDICWDLYWNSHHSNLTNLKIKSGQHEHFGRYIVYYHNLYEWSNLWVWRHFQVVKRIQLMTYNTRMHVQNPEKRYLIKSIRKGNKIKRPAKLVLTSIYYIRIVIIPLLQIWQQNLINMNNFWQLHY